MNKISWLHIIAILALILMSILRYTEKISEANFMQIFLLILGGVGLLGAYIYGYVKGREIPH